jgi:hypothetical protein
MLFCALASDYDGTLARDGRIDAPTLAALRRFKATGKRLILITDGSSPTCARYSSTWMISTPWWSKTAR